MRLLSRNSIVYLLIFSFVLALGGPFVASAATTPTLGTAGTFGVLSSTFTRNIGLTVITGDAGYTTLSGGGTNTVSGTAYSPAPAQAGIDQDTALAALNSEACTFTFPAGAIDLALDTTHGPLGVYTPGVYCTGAASAASIGTAGITLSGAGTYIFRINGALTSVSNAIVTLANGASACDVFWTPSAAVTLGANNTFIGNIIDNSGITIGNTTTLIGRALNFATTITADSNTITVPSCSPAPAVLHVIKLVVNGSGGGVSLIAVGTGTAVPSDFFLHVKNAGVDVAGSPAPGSPAPGITYSLSPGTYTVSEDANASYTQFFGGDCDDSGNVTLISGDDKVCTIVNTDIPPPDFVPIAGSGSLLVAPLIGVMKIPTPLALPSGSGLVTYNYTVWNIGGLQALANVTLTDDKCSPVTFTGGDNNNNGKLDPQENWTYSCMLMLYQTTTNTAIATGYSDDATHQAAIATAIATVAVVPGLPDAGLIPPLINIIKVPSRLTPFPAGGGQVMYRYTVTNPGIVSMSDVGVTDDKCAPVTRASGDINGNNLLDSGEAWIFGCETNVSVSTRNVATALGRANGFTALGYAFATVYVSVPNLPDTGFPPETNTTPLIDFLSIVAALAGLIVLLPKKLKV